MPTFHAALLCLLVGSPLLAAEAQIYRCETPKGIVYSDRECGESAEVVEIEDTSQGIEPGPPEEVREYLADKREERAKALEESRKAVAQAPPPPPPPVVIERGVVSPFLWPGYGYQRPPVLRPKPPYRPRPEPPIEPPLRPPQRPGDTLRPLR